MNKSIITAENRTVEGTNGISYTYRRLGPDRPVGVPVIFLQHFRGNIDNWDPQLVDSIAVQREVIVFDNVGVGSTTGTTPSSVAQMARDAITFLEALELKSVDLFGFSLGSFVAQEIALIRPAIVNKLILAGAGPQGAPQMHGWRQDIADHARADQPGAEDLLYIFFAHTETSQTKGGATLGRIFSRGENRDGGTNWATRDAHYDAIVDWGIPDHSKLQRLTGIKAPTLILQGDDDLMIPTKLSYLLAGLIPDAKIKIYPDAAHASIFQYADEAAADVLSFLGA